MKINTNHSPLDRVVKIMTLVLLLEWHSRREGGERRILILPYCLFLCYCLFTPSFPSTVITLSRKNGSTEEGNQFHDCPFYFTLTLSLFLHTLMWNTSPHECHLSIMLFFHLSLQWFHSCWMNIVFLPFLSFSSNISTIHPLWWLSAFLSDPFSLFNPKTARLKNIWYFPPVIM